eukprot:344009-Chlamydomonas_euryale.AAC.1
MAHCRTCTRVHVPSCQKQAAATPGRQATHALHLCARADRHGLVLERVARGAGVEQTRACAVIPCHQQADAKRPLPGALRADLVLVCHLAHQPANRHSRLIDVPAVSERMEREGRGGGLSCMPCQCGELGMRMGWSELMEDACIIAWRWHT